ncbi:WXG100 family type VII secretion target [Kineosporia sp. A_224]|uniref:WXG100 family type VII secretion target n=1 Tax=Kineosporia sp. A_224 TaxID=1962180 RepID=UPI000B4AC565|nr:WXG100 family type VII secretion target [Kineosporia sp. A_224]
MSQHIAVTPTELRDQATQVSNGAADVSELLGRLLGQVRDLAARWEGSGSEAFQQLFEEWRQGADMTRQGMEGIAAFLNNAATAFEDVDDQIRQAAQR